MKKHLRILTSLTAACAVLNTSVLAQSSVPTTGAQDNNGTVLAVGSKSPKAKTGVARQNSLSFNPSVPFANLQVTPSPVLMYEIALDGPDRTSTNFPAWASNVVATVYATGQPLTLSNSWSHGYRLSASDLYQPAGTNNSTLWFAIHIVAVNPSYMFTPSNVWFIENSSDPADSLRKTNTFNNPTYAYSPWGMGIVWGPNGPRTSDTILDNPSSGGWNNQPVNEFIFIGAESVYYTGDSNNVAGYMNSFTAASSGFSVTGQWFLQCSNVTALSQVTVQTLGAPLPPLLTIHPGLSGNATNVWLGINMETNRTVVVQYRTPLVGGFGWSDICTMNAGDTITWPTDVAHGTFDQGYYRFYMEQ